ncbi:MAG: FMN-binding protein [Clostridiales bacterium]|nr:FMN-binding protein [Clostridiales bacterium]
MDNRMKVFAPILSAVLVVACIGASLSSWSPTVYEVQAIPEQEVEDEDTADEDDAEEENEVQGSFELDDGIYYGSGTGYAGKISVAVTIDSKSITEIEVTEVEADDSAFFNRAKGVIEEIIRQQSLEVDVVSGATCSSRGIISAVKNALYGEEDDGEVAADRASTGLGSTTVSETTDAAAYKDGTYYGSATGFAGTVTVKVIISGGEISSISIVSHSDGSSYMAKASALLDSIVSTQSTNVDTVSGATYSSVGLINAVRNALAQAAVSETAASETTSVATVNTSKSSASSGSASFIAPEVSSGSEGNFPYPDGTYYGTGEGFGGNITVAVVIKDQTIDSVTILSADDETPEYFAQAAVLADAVVTAQSADLDVVSGATYSSEGILEAVKNALAAAKAAADAEDGTSGDDSSGSSDSDDANTAASGGSSTGTNGDSENNDNDSAGDGNNSSSDGSDDSTNTDASQKYADGVYTVTVICDPDEDEDFEAYNLTAVVTFEGDKVVSVEVSGDGDSANDTYINWAANGRSSYVGVVTQIVALEEVTESSVEEVDTVSRATCSSVSIKEACLKAVRQAAEAQESENGDGISENEESSEYAQESTSDSSDEDAGGSVVMDADIKEEEDL